MMRDEFPGNSLANASVIPQCKCGMRINVMTELFSKYSGQECCNLLSHSVD
jgi:hypothetical protein